MRKNISLLALLLVLVASYFLFFFDRPGSLDPDDTAFAVRDTAAVTRIRITRVVEGNDTEQLDLTRSADQAWLVNEQYPAFLPQLRDFMDMLYLIQVKETLVGEGLKTADRLMDLRHTRVEIFGRKGLLKAYRVGTATKDYKGTLMWLQNAAQPYVVERPGLQGFLNPFFNPDPNVWRANLLFRAQATELADIQIDYRDAPQQNVHLRQEGKDWQLVGQPAWNGEALQAYLDQFQGAVYAERFVGPEGEPYFAPLRNQVPQILFSLNYQDGSKRSIVLHQPVDDRDRFWGWVQGEDEALTIQHYVFDKFLLRADDLLPTAPALP